jgi:hypothetical protein
MNLSFFYCVFEGVPWALFHFDFSFYWLCLETFRWKPIISNGVFLKAEGNEPPELPGVNVRCSWNQLIILSLQCLIFISRQTGVFSKHDVNWIFYSCHWLLSVISNKSTPGILLGSVKHLYHTDVLAEDSSGETCWRKRWRSHSPHRITFSFFRACTRDERPVELKESRKFKRTKSWMISWPAMRTDSHG